MNRDIFSPMGLQGGLSDQDQNRPRLRDLKSQQKTMITQDVDFKKLLEESQRMSQNYMRTSAALNARAAGHDSLMPLQIGQPATGLLSSVGGLQQTGRSMQQLYDQLNNDMAATRTDQLSNTETAQVKQWLASKGFSYMDFESDITSLRAYQKLISDERQAQLAPGAKFGRLGGNRALDNNAFLEQVFESGNANNQIQIDRRLGKGYHGKLLAKLHKQSKLLTLQEDDYEGVQLESQPLRDIPVRARGHVGVAKQALDSSELFENKSRSQGNIAMADDRSKDALKNNYALSQDATEIIKRAKRDLPAVDEYDVRYLDELIKDQVRRMPAQGHLTSEQESSFLHYLRALSLYAEGKYISRRQDVSMMAKKLASLEQDLGQKSQNDVIHWELHDVWRMIETLEGAIPQTKRPSQVDILRSMADQRKPIAGSVSKDPLECRIAAVSCQNLESLYALQVTKQLAESAAHRDAQERLMIFKNKSARIVQDFIDRTNQFGQQLQNYLVIDNSTEEYPYLTILLLYRAGLHQDALQYCSRSNLPHVRHFGDEIYQKCVKVYGGKLPQEELAGFMSHSQSSSPEQYDVARDALVHLMTGCTYVQQQYQSFLFDEIFEGDVNSWLWFHLKLASFEFKPRSGAVGGFIDYRANSMPSNYKAYFLEDLVQEVTDRSFSDRYWVRELDQASNQVRFAKVYFYVGEFQQALDKLLQAGLTVEATVIGTALTDLSMLATKQSIYSTVKSRDPETKRQLAHFTDQELARFYDASLDLDSHLLLLAFQQCNQQRYLTEAFVLIYMVQVEQLQLTAMGYFIRKHQLDDMLLENDRRFVLDFEINKDYSLRQFLGPEHFKKLIRRSVEIIGDQDREACIALLDKIQETKKVLETIIALQVSQIEQSKPLRFVSPAENVQDNVDQYQVFETDRQRTKVQRAAETFRQLLNDYRKEGQGQTHSHLFQVIDQLDLVQEAFEPISNKIDVTLEALTSAYRRLDNLDFLPKYKALKPGEHEGNFQDLADKFMDLDLNLQEVTLDCVMAISKIAMHLMLGYYGNDQVSKTIWNTSVNVAGAASVQNSTVQQVKQIRDDIKKRKEYQDYLTQYVDMLAYRQKEARMARFEGRLDRYAHAMRSIRLEMQ